MDLAGDGAAEDIVVHCDPVTLESSSLPLLQPMASGSSEVRAPDAVPETSPGVGCVLHASQEGSWPAPSQALEGAPLARPGPDHEEAGPRVGGDAASASEASAVVDAAESLGTEYLFDTADLVEGRCRARQWQGRSAKM